jgi:hypothetical protein
VTPRRVDRAIVAALAFGTAAYLLPLRRYGLMIVDDGWILQPVQRMRAGEILYRDVWTFYAPGMHHLVAWLFAWTGPSLGAVRTLYAAMIVASVACIYRFARRFAPPFLASVPAAVYGLVPGPWHKAYFGLLGVASFLLLARALERPTARRFGALGALAGIALVTRQDVGILALAITVIAAALPAWRPAVFALPGASGRETSLRAGAAAGIGWAPWVAATAAYYAAHGALGPLLDACFGTAFGQAAGHPGVLGDLLRPATFALAPEGRAVGVVMLLPLVVYPAAGLVLLLRLRRDGVTVDTALRGALLAFAGATLSQAYHPFLLLRFLQSAIPFYLLATITAADAGRALGARQSPLARAPAVALAGAGAAFVALVFFGLPLVVQPVYTGSLRMLRYDTPIELWGARVLESFGVAEEVRLVRAFYDRHAAPGEPTVGFPQLSGYNLLLDRPNPTAWIGEHPTGNFVLSAERKRGEAARLLASPARFVLVDQGWWARLDARDPMLETLRAEFHPVRGYGSLLILARGTDPEWRAFAERLRRALTAGPRAEDLSFARTFAAAHPDEPLAWRMVAFAATAAGAAPLAIEALHRTADLDPADATPLESAAQLLARTNRRDEALADIARARQIRDSETLRTLTAQLQKR